MDKQVIIKNGELSAVINYVGAELVSLKKDGKEYIWQGDDRFWKSHAPVLFPVCGGLKDDTYYLDGKKYIQQKHGYVRKVPFELVDKKEDQVVFLLTETPQSLEGFPFKFRLYIKYLLTDRLEIEYKVENTDDKDMFFTIGSHAGFVAEGNFSDYSVGFEKEEELKALTLYGSLIGDEYTDLGKTKELQLDYRYFDVDALVFKDIKSKKLTLKHKEKGEILSLCSDDNFKHLLLWTKPDAPYICIEPWVALPDRVDSTQDITKKPDVVKVEKGSSKVFLQNIKVI